MFVKIASGSWVAAALVTGLCGCATGPDQPERQATAGIPSDPPTGTNFPRRARTDATVIDREAYERMKQPGNGAMPNPVRTGP